MVVFENLPDNQPKTPKKGSSQNVCIKMKKNRRRTKLNECIYLRKRQRYEKEGNKKVRSVTRKATQKNTEQNDALT